MGMHFFFSIGIECGYQFGIKVPLFLYPELYLHLLLRCKISKVLTLTMLQVNSADNKLMIFFLLPRK